MNTKNIATSRALVAVATAFIVTLAAAPQIAAAGGDQSALPAQLPNARISFIDGINRAARLEGFPISAKFEMAGKELHLSVYTAKQGKEVAAEQNQLIELAGDATKVDWAPQKEVFTDKPHIARSAMHLTIMQQSQLGLVRLVGKAQAKQAGTIYSITPALQHGKPGYKLLTLLATGKTTESWIDLAGQPMP
jgi:hypothetical protein